MTDQQHVNGMTNDESSHLDYNDRVEERESFEGYVSIQKNFGVRFLTTLRHRLQEDAFDTSIASEQGKTRIRFRVDNYTVVVGSNRYRWEVVR